MNEPPTGPHDDDMRPEYDFSGGVRGKYAERYAAGVRLPEHASTTAGTTRVTITLDDDVLDWFRDQVEAAGGGNYQTLINNALREHIQQRREPLEDTLRRVLREELLEDRRRTA